MVNANELRIGNWLKRPTQPNGFLVDANTISRMFYNVRDEEPIPLTPNMLERLGFKIFDDRERGSGISGTSEWAHGLEVEVILGYNFFRIWGINYQIKIQSVHQLQNLHFALTGKELPITL